MTGAILSALEIAADRGLPRVRLKAGETVFLKGEDAAEMYVVASGTLEILMYGYVLGRITAGGIVGEMALIDGGDRSAAALAETETELIAINRDTFLSLAQEEPRFALAVLEIMAERLRTATRRKAAAG